ncbi:MAG: T9SS C-terminal target domain-containing protein [Crocinitomicaceae bacterium]|nr:T9SS C-terminal target domain-containing protein [Crocinitomicaceae bacterium]NDA97903.1 T9SS C-terminal target domain-containing protein [Flavobacteriia bacterium]NDC28070.1 T9SS C-terminal target domain-containing protein [Crocinitomicaceae bacterium]NDC92340.1 T9SS C-terminal target domain-containing protein [Flavobacteriales bacterium]
MNIKLILFFFSFLFVNLTYAQWTNRNTGQGDFSANFNASTKDNQGNLYFCGSAVNVDQNKDILVIKTSSTGDTLWTNVYNGPASGMDEATAIAVDNSANVYITGYHRGSGTGTDMVTIKYNFVGEIQWIQPYLSSIQSDQTDKGNSITLDGSGNIYVTGQSDSDPSINNNDNYITIKYNSAGLQQWIRVKNGLGNGTDRPIKIALDASNNPIVTGRSFNGSEDDYLTIKYNDIDGTTLWERILDRTNHDRPTDMVIDFSSNNIYVTGRSKNITYDYVTVAYSSTGNFLWQAVYDYIEDDRATCISLTPSGEILVSGQSDFDLTTNFNYNITTVKYSTAGIQQWTQTFSGTAGNDDVPVDIESDANGNVFVSGYTDAIPGAIVQNNGILIGYSSAGLALFNKSFSLSTTSNDIHSSMMIASNNDIVICGGSEVIPVKHATFMRYSNTGSEIWNKKYVANGDNSNNSHSIVVDNQGNTYVAGYSVEYGADRNHSLLKIDPNGNTLWLKTLNGTSSSGSPDEAYGIAIDATGFIYVGGFLKNTGASYDIILAKYNDNGDTIWTRKYDYTLVGGSDKAFQLAIDGQGNVFLTGRSDSDPTVNSNTDAITLKYNASGSLLWSNRYNGISNGSDQTRQIKVATTGNVYVAGRTFNGVNNDVLLIKYSNAGVQQWVKTYDGGGTDEVFSMEIDNSENVIVTGFTQANANSDTNILILKYNSLGYQQWIHSIDGAGHGKDLGNSVATDLTGNVFVAGTVDNDNQSTTFNNDIMILKYDPLGNQLWNIIYNNGSNLDDEAEEIKLDAFGDLYLTGRSDSISNLGENYDYIALKYLSNGTLNYQYRFNGNANSRDIPSTICVKGLEFFISGASLDSSDQRNMVTVKRSTDPNASIVESKINDVLIYPNPAQNYITIELNTENSLTNYSLFDISGKQLISNAELLKKNKIDISCFQPGIYFIKISSVFGSTVSYKLVIN